METLACSVKFLYFYTLEDGQNPQTAWC